MLMREIERKPIPLKSKGLTGDLKRLKEPTDSFLIENKGLKRAVLYSTASRLGIRIITAVEGDGLRVWRNFDVEAPNVLKAQPTQVEVIEAAMDIAELPMSRQEKLDNLRMLQDAVITGQNPLKPVVDDEWAGWSEERSQYDEPAGETIYYREHLKTRKRREIRRETYYG